MSDDLISRQAAIKDAESWVAVDEYEKHLQKNVVEWLKEFPSAEHGTNLAQVGTDLISRQAAIDALAEDMPSAYTPDGPHPADDGIFMAQEIYADCIQTLKELPSAQPEIIRCRECKFASGDSRICMKFDHSPIGELDFCSFAERREVNNESD